MIVSLLIYQLKENEKKVPSDFAALKKKEKRKLTELKVQYM